MVNHDSYFIAIEVDFHAKFELLSFQESELLSLASMIFTILSEYGKNTFLLGVVLPYCQIESIQRV